MQKSLFIVILSLVSSGLVPPVLADEVNRPVAYEPLESLRQTAALVVKTLQQPVVGERVSSNDTSVSLPVGNLVALSGTVEELDSVPSETSLATAIDSAPRASFGRLETRSLASLSGDRDDEMTLEQVKQSQSYYSYRDFVVSHKDRWKELQNDAGFFAPAESLFKNHAETDPNHRSREVFARFLSRVGPDTPTSATARPETGSAEKTH